MDNITLRIIIGSRKVHNIDWPWVRTTFGDDEIWGWGHLVMRTSGDENIWWWGHMWHADVTYGYCDVSGPHMPYIYIWRIAPHRHVSGTRHIVLPGRRSWRIDDGHISSATFRFHRVPYGRRRINVWTAYYIYAALRLHRDVPDITSESGRAHKYCPATEQKRLNIDMGRGSGGHIIWAACAV